ncbi:4-hydroxythreonine-4-phosphate dehydrogenase PdxA [Gemmatimonadota bacterium]
MRPRVAITVGDPRGIGPEIVSKVLENAPGGADYLVVGPKECVAGLPGERIILGELGTESGAGLGSESSEGVGQTPAHGLSTPEPVPRSPLQLSPAAAGRLVGLQVKKAVSLALAGTVDAIVTGPAEKKALQLAGFRYPGHTEWLGELAGGVPTTMMLVAGKLRVVLITTHIALREVPESVTRERILTAARHTERALRDWWGISEPRIAVCALNPHAGDSGIFGVEDDEVLAPAAREIGAAGPLPADTVFVKALRGEFDAVLAPYHDVGMTAVKVAGFGKGVNVTLGLPFIRTAPDHGTALDIAGQGIADPGSMRQAVLLAVELVRRRVS